MHALRLRWLSRQQKQFPHRGRVHEHMQRGTSRAYWAAPERHWLARPVTNRVDDSSSRRLRRVQMVGLVALQRHVRHWPCRQLSRHRAAKREWWKAMPQEAPSTLSMPARALRIISRKEEPRPNPRQKPNRLARLTQETEQARIAKLQNCSKKRFSHRNLAFRIKGNIISFQVSR